MHGSFGVATKKTNEIKRQVTYFTCDACQSTFDNKQKVKKHIKEQHGKEQEDTAPSPVRKAQKPENLDQRIEDTDNIVEEEEGEKM